MAVENEPVPPPRVESEYPLIDSDPHFLRVIRYARPSDWAVAAATAAAGPAAFWWMDKVSPSGVSKSGFASVFRLSFAVGLSAGFFMMYSKSTKRFWGWTENAREVEMDMKEMVGKVKRGEPLYGTSMLSPYMQGVAARNSRGSQLFIHAIPWFNFVNHNEHGVDTAKYYKAAEAELEAEGRK